MKTRWIVLAAAVALIMVGGCATGTIHREPFITGGTLVWYDNFDGDELDRTRWNIDTGTGSQFGLTGWGNYESQFYRPENVFVQDGMLVLEVRNDGYAGMPFTSGKVTTGGTITHDGVIYPQRFAVMPGSRVEARIKSTRGVGLWPAFWMLGTTSNQFGDNRGVVHGWPRAGEIDILEIRGGNEHRLYGTIHYGPYWPLNRHDGQFIDLPTSMADEWNVFGVTWDRDTLHFLLNGEVWHTMCLRTKQQEWARSFIREAFSARTGFFININVAVGGNFIGMTLPDPELFDEDTPVEDRRLLVDWIRVYAP